MTDEDKPDQNPEQLTDEQIARRIASLTEHRFRGSSGEEMHAWGLAVRSAREYLDTLPRRGDDDG